MSHQENFPYFWCQSGKRFCAFSKDNQIVISGFLCLYGFLFLYYFSPVLFTQRVNCDSCIESHLINTRNTLNKITGVAKPEQLIGLLHQTFASGMAYILGGKKTIHQKTKQTKSKFTHIGGIFAVLHSEKISSGSREQSCFLKHEDIVLSHFHSIWKKP